MKWIPNPNLNFTYKSNVALGSTEYKYFSINHLTLNLLAPFSIKVPVLSYSSWQKESFIRRHILLCHFVWKLLELWFYTWSRRAALTTLKQFKHPPMLVLPAEFPLQQIHLVGKNHFARFDYYPFLKEEVKPSRGKHNQTL